MSEAQTVPYRETCGKCGAVRIDRQIGLEASLDEYIMTLVEVFREVRRVMRDDAVLFLNLGDSYAAVGGVHKNGSYDGGVGRHMNGMQRQTGGLKPKDLMMVPARVAIALQADGWYLRSDIIWAKKAPMPESVTDRPTSAHEHVFLLTKKARYFFDMEAVKEQGVEPDRQRLDRIGGVNGHTVRHSEGGVIGASATRNLRNVWHLGPESFADAHFAIFPTEIPRRAILAGTSAKGCCAACGAPLVRIIQKGPPPPEPNHRHPTKRLEPGQAGNVDNGNMGFRASRLSGQEISAWRSEYPDQTIGWKSPCHCDAGIAPCIVLDPFSGAGTTGLVADRLGRDSILIELNPAYAEMTEQRIRGDAPLFANVEMT